MDKNVKEVGRLAGRQARGRSSSGPGIRGARLQQAMTKFLWPRSPTRWISDPNTFP
jgi:hypothetical protein